MSKAQLYLCKVLADGPIAGKRRKKGDTVHLTLSAAKYENVSVGRAVPTEPKEPASEDGKATSDVKANKKADDKA